jgi:hypothetical protein
LPLLSFASLCFVFFLLCFCFVSIFLSCFCLWFPFSFLLFALKASRGVSERRSEQKMEASTAALLGALIGATAGVVGQLVGVAYTSRNERRRLAVETGFREWEQLLERVKQPGDMIFPPVLFVHFNSELIRLIDSRSGLTPENYRVLLQRRDEVRKVIREDNEAKP